MWRPFKNIEKDKLEHALVGVIIFGIIKQILSIAVSILNLNVGITAILAISVILVSIIAYLTEIYQRRTGTGQYDDQDMIWTTYGGLFASITGIIF